MTDGPRQGRKRATGEARYLLAAAVFVGTSVPYLLNDGGAGRVSGGQARKGATAGLAADPRNARRAEVFGECRDFQFAGNAHTTSTSFGPRPW